MSDAKRIYYVIKPTTIQHEKVVVGDALALTEAQGRPLVNGGFLTLDRAAATLISELSAKLKEHTQENTAVKKKPSQSSKISAPTVNKTSDKRENKKNDSSA